MDDGGMLKVVRLFLLKDQGLSKLISGIFTVSSVQAAYPYATLGVESVKRGNRRTKICFHLKIWSTYQGIKQLQSIDRALQQCFGKPGIVLPVSSPGQGGSEKVLVFKALQQHLDVQQQGVSCLTYHYEALMHPLVQASKGQA